MIGGCGFYHSETVMTLLHLDNQFSGPFILKILMKTLHNWSLVLGLYFDVINFGRWIPLKESVVPLRVRPTDATCLSMMQNDRLVQS